MDGWILFRPEALSLKGLGTLTTYDSAASPKVSHKSEGKTSHLELINMEGARDGACSTHFESRRQDQPLNGTCEAQHHKANLEPRNPERTPRSTRAPANPYSPGTNPHNSRWLAYRITVRPTPIDPQL
jgi:hypothetical protein